MKVLIDTGHPAHIHLFRNFASEMLKEGHSVLFTCREKQLETDLLKYYGLPFVSLGRKSDTIIGKMTGLIRFNLKLLSVAVEYKPDIYLSHGSHYAAHVAFLTGKPHIALEDTFNFEQMWLYKPFSDAILTADYPHPLNSSKILRYSGYHELAYLHPSRFVPDRSVLQELGVSANEKYVILRFGSWKASHDIGHKGIATRNKIEAVSQFSNFARVFISSESTLPDALEQYRIKIAPYRMHDAMAFASMIWAESFTMPSEGAVLGTPSVVIHNSRSLYLEEQQDKYGLCWLFSESEEDQRRAINKGIELLRDKNISEECMERRNRMLNDKIDVTAMLVWFIQQWPGSFGTMKQDPDYQKRFRTKD